MFRWFGRKYGFGWSTPPRAVSGPLKDPNSGSNYFFHIACFLILNENGLDISHYGLECNVFDLNSHPMCFDHVFPPSPTLPRSSPVPYSPDFMLSLSHPKLKTINKKTKQNPMKNKHENQNRQAKDNKTTTTKKSKTKIYKNALS